MSLEAARTRMRMHQAYLAKLLPESGVATLMGYSLCPIHSPVFQSVTVCGAGAAAVVATEVVNAAIPSTKCVELPLDRASL